MPTRVVLIVCCSRRDSADGSGWRSKRSWPAQRRYRRRAALGKGSILGTILAACTLGLIGNLLFFAGVNSYWQYVIAALIVISVVGIPVISRRIGAAVRGIRA